MINPLIELFISFLEFFGTIQVLKPNLPTSLILFSILSIFLTSPLKPSSPINTFAREAKKIVVDIDKTELNKFKKFKLNIDIKVNEDLKIFTKNLLKYNFFYSTFLINNCRGSPSF